ncbi:MAG: DUF4157 domain-containing protein [bacterium]
MHEFESEPLESLQRRATPGEADIASPTAGRPPGRAPLAVHTEASLLHLQRTAGNAGVVQMLADESEQARQDAGPSPVHDVIGKGGGAPLDESTRSSMESRFGQDFGDVRVHTDSRASESAEAVGANAYTVGHDVVFRSGHFDSSSPTGQRTIAHELSHVVQQRSGPVDGTEAPGGIRLSDPDDRFERAADSTADQVMSAPAPAPVQMEASEEAEPGVEMPVQREVGDEDEDEMSST